MPAAWLAALVLSILTTPAALQAQSSGCTAVTYGCYTYYPESEYDPNSYIDATIWGIIQGMFLAGMLILTAYCLEYGICQYLASAGWIQF